MEVVMRMINFLPVLARHVRKVSGLIETSLLDVPNINSGSTAQQMFDVCNGVIESFSLDWENCITLSSDNTNSIIGAHNSLLKKIEDSHGDQKVFDGGCPCHLAHLCTRKGAKELTVNVEDFVIDIYCHFRRSAKHKAQLSQFSTLTCKMIWKIQKMRNLTKKTD